MATSANSAASRPSITPSLVSMSAGRATSVATPPSATRTAAPVNRSATVDANAARVSPMTLRSPSERTTSPPIVEGKTAL
jgi:hypothetical protein